MAKKSLLRLRSDIDFYLKSVEGRLQMYDILIIFASAFITGRKYVM